MLPSSPPKYSSWSAMTAPIKVGERGWRAYAVQCVVDVDADGIWGKNTDAAVKKWQVLNKLVSDGIVGPRTQLAMLIAESKRVDERFNVIPDGLLKGFARVEGANLLAPTNWYSPSPEDQGCDCGPVQWRQKGPPFDIENLKLAFDPYLSFTYAARVFTGRISNYRYRRPSLTERTLVEIAVLAHNAPFLTEQIVRNGQLSTPNALARWTTIPESERSNYQGRTHYTHAEWRVEYPRRVLTGVNY